jgi:nitrile hydratase accessory protein
MTLALHERGLFTWSEWAQALAGAVRQAQANGDRDDGSTYYRRWLSALEHLAAAKGMTSDHALEERRAAWQRAAEATPHGQPILLDNDPAGREPA